MAKKDRANANSVELLDIVGKGYADFWRDKH